MATETFEISRDDLVNILSNRYRTPSTCINIVGTVEKVEITVYTPDWEIEYAKRFREEKENKKNMNEINWEEIRKIIDDTAAKRDRKVMIFISPITGTSVSIEPWPDMDDLYQMYQEGKITFNDFRVRSGLSLIREEDFINSKSRTKFGGYSGR